MTTKPKTRKEPPAAPWIMTLAQAIARHEAAQAALDAVPHDQDCPSHLCMAEFDALDELAKTHCASDAEFIEKLRYLCEYENRISVAPTGEHEFGSVVLAVDRHFFPVNG